MEEQNTLAHNLAAHIHVIGAPATAAGQTCADVDSHAELLLPADVAASGFYVTNAHNVLRGNAASGGCASYAGPKIPAPPNGARTQGRAA